MTLKLARGKRMQSQFDFPYNSPKRRSAYCLDSLHGAFSQAKEHSIVYDCCQAERFRIRPVKDEFLVFRSIGKDHEGWLQADHIHI